jgi:tetratricopeptide (TPR) repeat protein
MTRENASDVSRSSLLSVVGIFIILLLLHLLPFLLPASRLWGFNHLLFLPDSFAYITIIAGVLAIAFLFRPLQHVGDGLFGYVGNLLAGPRYWWWLAIALASLPLFWFLRMPTNMLGDGYTVINNVGNDLPVILKWSEIGVIKLVYTISQILPYTGLKSAEYAYALVSTVSGGAALFLFFGVAHELGRDKIERLFILCLLIFSGWILLFFGYVENYPILWPFMVGYVYFSIRYIKKQNTLLVPTLFLLVALALHLQISFFLISYLVLLTARGYGARFYHQRKSLFWTILGLAFAAGAVLFVWRYQNALEFRIHFMPLIHGQPPAAGYTLLSITHLLDIANEFLLIIPLLPLLILVGWRDRKAIIKDRIDRFLLFFAFGGLILIFALDPKLGMGRDWDLFALTGVGTLLLLARVAILSDRWKKIFPGAVLFSAVMVFPFLATNLSYQPSLDYYKWLLRLDQPRCKPGMTALRDYYQNIGDSVTVDSLQQEMVANFPLTYLAPRAYNLAQAGRFGEALALADSVFRSNPQSVESFNLRGTIYQMMGDNERAIPDFEQSARLGQYDSRTLVNMAQAYQQVGRFDEVMEPLRRAGHKSYRRNRNGCWLDWLRHFLLRGNMIRHRCMPARLCSYIRPILRDTWPADYRPIDSVIMPRRRPTCLGFLRWHPKDRNAIERRKF